jgi:hypothetical protein
MTDASAIWLGQLLENLGSCGPAGEAALQYLKEHNVKVGLRDQATGARWTLGGSIQLQPRFAESEPDAPYPLSLVIHEIRHLQQGWMNALSMHGELEAWHAQFAFLKSITGQYHVQPQYDEIIRHLMSLPVNWDRIALKEARKLMQAYSGRAYRIDLLPLYPLPKEFLYWAARRQPKGI